MAQPTRYDRAYGFTGYQAANPSSPLPANQVDAELDAVGMTTDEIRTNLALIQRDDGLLANGSVHPDALSAATLALVGSEGFTPRGAWVTATSYAVGDMVEYALATYVAAAAHVSSTFAADRAASRWLVIDENAESVIAVKAPVRAATTAAISRSGTMTLDGVVLVAGDRVLDKDASPAADRGIYVVAAGAWARAADFDVDADVVSGTTVYVLSGTVNAGRTYAVATADPIAIGTTALSWKQVGGHPLVETIAMLRATSADAVDSRSLVNVLGYYEVNDGGGGLFVADLADTTTADNGGTVIVDAAGTRWKRQYGGGSLTPAMFGGVADTSLVDGAGTSASAALQAAIDAAEAFSGTQIPDIIIPAGVWLIDESVVATKPIRIVGRGKYQSTLLVRLAVPDGTTPGLNLQAGGVVEDLQIRGFVSDDTNYFVADSVAMSVGSTVECRNVDLLGFEKLVIWDGGYYHKFLNCAFQRFLKGFPAWNANNVSFVNSRAVIFDTFFEYDGGTGPVSVLACAFESWTGRLFSGISGARAHITFAGNYVENYPANAAGLGLPDANFDSGQGIVGAKSLVCIGNAISLKGVTRWLNNGDVLDNLTSVGNLFNVFDASPNNTTDYVYAATSYGTVEARDNFNGTFAGSGYVTGTLTNPEACRIINPATYVDDSPAVAWTAATLENGWTNDGGSGVENAAYRRVRKYIELRGMVDGGAATGQTIFTLPTGLRPSSTRILSVATFGGTPTLVSIRILATGAVRVENTTYAINNVSLDGLRFYL